MKFSSSQFVALVTTLGLIFLAALGWSGLVQDGGAIIVIVVFLAIAGIVPFLIGLIVQAIFRKRSIPSYISWALAFILVFTQWLLTLQTALEVPNLPLVEFIGSVLIIGLFMDTGMKSCRAFREGLKAQQGS